MLPDVPVSKLPPATLPLQGNEVAILNQNGLTCTAPIGSFPPLTTISVSGDISGSGSAGSLVLTLPTINPDTGGPFNSFTVNGKGQVLTATSISTVLSGDVSGSGIGAITTTIGANTVTDAKLSQVAAGTYKGNPTAATANPSDHTLPPFGNCQLQLSSSTQLALMPFNGNQITFPNGYVYSVPSSGLSSGSVNAGCHLNGVANSTLSINTLYYCYLWYNAGTPVLDFSLVGHSVDATTGIVVKTGDTSRVLLGMVYPQVGPTLVDSSSARLVASWFNRQQKYISKSFTTNRTVSKSSVCEVNSEIQNLFLSWGDAFEIVSNQSCAANTLNSLLTNTIGIDGTSNNIASVSFTEFSINAYNSMSCAAFYAPTEGKHYVTTGGSVSAGVGTWLSGGTLQVRINL